MIVLTPEQQRAYNRFITARNKMGLGKKRTGEWIPQRECLATVDVAGQNHPMYIQNDDWLEYKEASLAWWAVEPEFRKAERMSSIRGDYGTADNWDDGSVRIRKGGLNED